MEKHVSFFKKKSFGKIKFGNTYKGKNWDDPDVPVDWLEWVASDDCRTSQENKDIARQVLNQRGICEGQLEDDRRKA